VSRVGLVGLVEPLAEILSGALTEEGHTAIRFPLDSDAVRNVRRAGLDVVVFDGHAYANTKAFLEDIRGFPQTANLPVVLLGPERPAEVPHFEVVHQIGRTLDLPKVLEAVGRATNPTG
jgi:hypothetical protein